MGGLETLQLMFYRTIEFDDPNNSGDEIADDIAFLESKGFVEETGD